MIRHFVSGHTPTDPDAARRYAFAASTWQAAFTEPTLIVSDLPRSSAMMGDPRPVPFIRDVFDYAAEHAGADLLVFTNSDVAVVSDIEACLSGRTCWFGQRVDVERFDEVYSSATLPADRPYVGADIFAFMPVWWRGVRDVFPDVLLGREGWDCIMKMLIGQCEPMNLIWHEKHRGFWDRGRNINTNPGQVHNRRLCRSWAIDHGHRDRLLPEGSRYLFR